VVAVSACGVCVSHSDGCDDAVCLACEWVQMSRARLGLYVFCRQSLFSRCYELSPTFSQFATRPSQLCLVPGETFPSTRSLAQSADSFPVESVQQLSSIVQQMAITALHGARPAPQPEIGGFVSVDVTEEQTSTTTTTSVAMADNEDVVMSEHVTTVPIVDRDAEAAATPPPDDHDVDTSSAIVPAALSPVPEPRAYSSLFLSWSLGEIFANIVRM
jgi:hypothetical protein